MKEEPTSAQQQLEEVVEQVRLVWKPVERRLERLASWLNDRLTR